MAFDKGCLSTYMPIYYKRLFPTKTLAKWLRYGQNDYFQRREFAFILPDDVYLRYKSFSDGIELERDIAKTVPEKVDIGAVFNYKPKDGRNKKDMCAMERELVFDIDMTDYDDVRTCCKGTDVCKKCWKFLVIAIKIIDSALEHDFGYQQRLWIFSGRRGVHCWVSDETARQLSSVARSAIVEYLTVVSGGENRSKKVELKGACLHPFIKRSVSIIEKYFSQLLLEQGWLDDEEKTKQVVSLVSDSALRQHIEADMMKCTSPAQRWQFLTVRSKRTDLPVVSQFFLEEIMLQLAYPRLDVNVTKGLNHLLKSPFCIHAKTGKVCIPLDIKNESKLMDFDPDKVPRLDHLCNELTALHKEQSAIEAVESEVENKKLFDYKRTSLKEYIEFFDAYVNEVTPIKERLHGKYVRGIIIELPANIHTFELYYTVKPGSSVYP